MKTSIMLVDDSVVVRRLVSNVIATADDFELVGALKTGVEATQTLEKNKPDVIVLDLEMPEMDGLETVREIRSKDPTTPILMFSALTSRGAEATMDCIAAGANDYVLKPSGLGSPERAMSWLQDELLPRLKGLHRQSTNSQRKLLPKRAPGESPVGLTSCDKMLGPTATIVGIGSSTGGPEVLAKIIPNLPADFPVPILISQHMPAVFTSRLAEFLDRSSPLKVIEAKDRSFPEAGYVYIAPGDNHLSVEMQSNRIQLSVNRQPRGTSTPSIDVLFRSLAETQMEQALVVVLTGMGSDGLAGAHAIKTVKGRVIAQDRSTSVIYGMPRVIVEAGLADSILPAERIAAGIRRYCKPNGLAKALSAGMTE